MMNFASSCKISHIDLSTKTKGWDKFIIIIIEDNVADFKQCLFVLTFSGWGYVVKGSRTILNTVAGCKVNTYNH